MDFGAGFEGAAGFLGTVALLLPALASPELTSCANAACAAYIYLSLESPEGIRGSHVPSLLWPSPSSPLPDPASASLQLCRDLVRNVRHFLYVLGHFHVVDVKAHHQQCRYCNICRSISCVKPSIHSYRGFTKLVGKGQV